MIHIVLKGAFSGNISDDNLLPDKTLMPAQFGSQWVYQNGLKRPGLS